MQIRVEQIHKKFGHFKALNDINLNIESGELIALLGPSGSGKTTLLRIIAGLEFADAGAVYFGGEDVIGTPLRERQIGFVFQHYALFKHMTIADNINFGLRVRPRGIRPEKQSIQERTEELLDLVQLSGLGGRYPHQLSGGQRQRVALARALAIEPKVLLLDEPFGALDAKVRKELRQWLRELHKKTGVTTLFVTHDQEEALELADRVVIMGKGKIAQVGSVDEVYERPASPMVFDFLGSTNRIPADYHDGQLFIHNRAFAHYQRDSQGPVTVYVRPADLRAVDNGEAGLPVTVLDVQRTGPIVRAHVEVQLTGQQLSVELPHLHHDVKQFVAKANLNLRLMQFSVYEAEQIVPSTSPLTPILIGRERLRSA